MGLMGSGGLFNPPNEGKIRFVPGIVVIDCIFHFISVSFFVLPLGGVRGGLPLKISFPLLLFHTGILVEIDNAGGAFGDGDSHHLFHNFFNGIGF